MQLQTQDAQCCNSAPIADGMERMVSKYPTQLMCEITALMSELICYCSISSNPNFLSVV